MDISTVRTFFMWCTILNVSLLFVSSAILAFARDWVYRQHTRWFPIPRGAFDVAIYSFLGLFKILILVLNAVPYAALSIMG